MDDDVDFEALLADLFQDTPLQNGQGQQTLQELLPLPAEPFPSLNPIELPLLQPLPSYNPQSGLTVANESSSSHVPSYVVAWPQVQLPQPAEPAVPKAAAPRERKKRVSSQSSVQQQVANLQQQLLVKEGQAKNLAKNNLWLTERMKMVETVITARDSQRSQLQLIQQGLGDFDPFAEFGTTVEAMQDVTPSQVADLILDLSGNMSRRLATVQPLLLTNPHLLTDSVYPTATMPACRPDGTPNPEAINWWRPEQPKQASLPALVDHTYASLLPDLQSVVDSCQGLCVAYSFLYQMHPRLLLAGSVRFQAVQDSGAVWETLVSEVEQLGQAVANLGIEGQLPVLAPEIQWRNVCANLKLSDHQRLKAAVLWDIISGARKAVHQQRMQLGAAMSQMLQVSHGPLAKASPGSDHQPSPIALGHQDGGFARRSGDSLLGGSLIGNSSGTDASGLLPSLGSGSIPGRGSADGGFNGGLPKATQSQGQAQGAGGAAKDSCSNSAVSVMMKGPDALHREQVLLERLQHTILKERCLIMLGAESMFRHIYTPVQCAVAMVSSYPYFPDHMALLHAAATEFQPDVLDRLVAASQAK